MSPSRPAAAPRSSTAHRLDRARTVLAQADLRGHTGSRTSSRPSFVPGAGELPVHPEFAELLPGGGLRRGSTVCLPADTPSLVLALLAEASARGSWCALVGLPEIGAVAAAEAGMDLSRLALVPDPAAELVAVLATLLDGVELVAVTGTAALRAGDRQRLTARTRAAGAVLLSLGSWPGADLRIDLTGDREAGPGGWCGICESGHGRLRERRVHLRAHGRGGAHAGQTRTVLLPGPSGRLAPAGPAYERVGPPRLRSPLAG
jgi:hypothetical protein